MPIRNPRTKLSLAAPVFERLRWEVEFLHLNSRVIPPDDPDGPKSRGDIIRRAVQLFVEFCEGGGDHECDYQETEACSFFFGKHEMGLWEYAVKQHYAVSYHELATLALDWYFGRIDEQEAADKATYAALQAIPVKDLETLLKSGRLEDELQAASQPA
jgi:hypothetical protein